MISNIVSGGRYLQVSGGGSTYVAKTYSSNAKMVGDMMYDIDTQSIKVYDGSNWVTLVSPSVTVGLTGDAENLLDWARQKRNEELELERLSKENPTIKDLVDKVNLYKDQIKMVQTLLKKEETIQHHPV